MTAPEFKEQYPHLAHLEGNALWDAMEQAVFLQQPPFVEQPGDDEIGAVEEYNGFTFSFTKGALRSFEMLDAPLQEDEGLSNYGILVPRNEFVLINLTNSNGNSEDKAAT